MRKMNAKQLRRVSNGSEASKVSTNHGTPDTSKNEIYIILDNVLDTFNIGSVFRLADAVNAKKVYLCGGSETPPNPRIKKASINTTEIVEWQYCESAVEAISDLKSQMPNVKVVAIEQAKGSVPYKSYEYKMPLALVVGNESYGVLPETLKDCDAVVELPMFGVNISLNVMVSLAIVLYHTISEGKE